LQITEVLWLQDVYDGTWDIGVGYRKPGTRWPDNWLSFGQEKVFIFIPIVLILVYMHGYYQIEEAAIYARY
jgi:hypothetical protein